MPEATPNPILNAPSPAAQKLELLRQLFPQAVETAPDGSVQVNAAAIQQALDPANPAGIRVEEDGFELRWVGKREAYHSAFVPPQKILQPLPEDSQAWDTTGNLLIKGDNLDALRLLRHSYFGKVKLIYIDPPYNTQSDAFVYRDNFSVRQSEVLSQLGYSTDNIDYIKNIYGARTHSGWLSFMYPRLLLAKDLLRDDGVIFISIDDNEQAQLKLLCDEVFGSENCIQNLIWKKSYGGGAKTKHIVGLHEYILCYAKNKEQIENIELPPDPKVLKYYKFKDEKFDTRGPFRLQPLATNSMDARENLCFPIPYNGEEIWPPKQWQWSKDRVISALEKDELTFSRKGDEWTVNYKQYLKNEDGEDRGAKPYSIIEGPYTQEGTGEIFELLGDGKIFPFPKPTRLIAHLISHVPNDAVVLDFFAGSGTTAEAVMRLNAEDGGKRQFILVQIPQPIDPKKQKEAHSFATSTLGRPEATIFEITAERIRRAGAKLQAQRQSDLVTEPAHLDTGFRVFALQDDPDALILQKPLMDATQADIAQLQAAIATPQPAHLPRILYNLLLAEGLPLTTPIEPLLPDAHPQALFRAADVLFIMAAVDTEALRALLSAQKAGGAPIQALSVYAPWVHDNNFLLGTQTLLETLGLSEDKLRLRG